MPKHANPFIAQVAMNPLLVDAGAVDLVEASLYHVVMHEHSTELLNASASAEDRDFWLPDDNYMSRYRPYSVIDGVLQIPVMGTLLSRFPWQVGRWATGYKYIEMAVRRGLADGNVRGIAFLIDSPGGEVTECFELADKLYNWRGEKPIRGFAANHAYSAAMMMFASTDNGKRTITRSGGCGSIGVVTAHIEYSEALKDMGIKVTFIYAGKHKVDGNPYEKLSASAKERTQARIDKIYSVFVSTVARNTGIDESKIRATEALTYDADEAIEMGLADRIGALEDELVVYATELAETGDEFMATPTQPNVTGKKTGDEATTYSQAEVDAMVAEARAEGVAEGAKAEGERISAIMALDEAKTRPAAASMLIELGVDAATAKAKLAKLPEEKAEAKPEDKNAITGKPTATRNHFEEHMNNSKHPNVSAVVEGDEEDDDESPQAKSNSILSAYGKAAGITRKKTA